MNTHLQSLALASNEQRDHMLDPNSIGQPLDTGQPDTDRFQEVIEHKAPEYLRSWMPLAMSRAQWAERLPFIQALVDGRTVLVREGGNTWHVVGQTLFDLPVDCYRVEQNDNLRDGATERRPSSQET